MEAAQEGPEAAVQADVQAASLASFAFAVPGVATPALRTWGTSQLGGSVESVYTVPGAT